MTHNIHLSFITIFFVADYVNSQKGTKGGHRVPCIETNNVNESAGWDDRLVMQCIRHVMSMSGS